MTQLVPSEASALPQADATRRNSELWAACIAGAIPVAAYVDALVEAGFEPTVTRRNEYRFVSERARQASETYGIGSVTIVATRR